MLRWHKHPFHVNKCNHHFLCIILKTLQGGSSNCHNLIKQTVNMNNSKLCIWSLSISDFSRFSPFVCNFGPNWGFSVLVLNKKDYICVTKTVNIWGPRIIILLGTWTKSVIRTSNKDQSWKRNLYATKIYENQLHLRP